MHDLKQKKLKEKQFMLENGLPVPKNFENDFSNKIEDPAEEAKTRALLYLRANYRSYEVELRPANTIVYWNFEVDEKGRLLGYIRFVENPDKKALAEAAGTLGKLNIDPYDVNERSGSDDGSFEVSMETGFETETTPHGCQP
jgi:hypothetical protein